MGSAVIGGIWAAPVILASKLVAFCLGAGSMGVGVTAIVNALCDRVRLTRDGLTSCRFWRRNRFVSWKNVVDIRTDGRKGHHMVVTRSGLKIRLSPSIMGRGDLMAWIRRSGLVTARRHKHGLAGF